MQSQIVTSACKIARELKFRADEHPVRHPRRNRVRSRSESPGIRTVPYLSKVTGIPMVDLATRCMMGEKLSDLGYSSGL